MKITDLQFSFILIKALPKSYLAVALTILATGAPKNLSPQMIQEQILNEEGQWSGPSASLNKVAPIKRKSDKPIYNATTVKRPGTKLMNVGKKKRMWRKRIRRIRQRRCRPLARQSMCTLYLLQLQYLRSQMMIITSGFPFMQQCNPGGWWTLEPCTT
jgi:hypothetical protein